MQMEKENQLIPITNRLKMFRKLRGYKQKEVAALLGLYNAMPIRQWEQGKQLPNTQNLIKLSILYRTYPNELYTEYCHELRQALNEKEFDSFKNL
jgi:transcriptional regulator with XRE-family HTH domain